MKTRINKDGRLTIPKSMRKEIGINIEEDIEMFVIGNKIVITKEENNLIEEYKFRINKALNELDDIFKEEDKFDSWYKVAEVYKEQINNAKKTLSGE